MNIQKKINLLGSLLIIALVLGGVSYCTKSESREASKDGEQAANSVYNAESSSAYQKGYNAGAATREKMFFYPFVKLVPKDYSEYSHNAMNTISGEEIRISLREIRIMLPEEAKKLNFISIVVGCLALFAGLFFIWTLFSFISEIKGGEIFVKGNEWKLKCMAAVSIFWFIIEWSTEIINFSFIKEIVSIDGYKVVMDHPSMGPLIMGITFLLFAAIFHMGRKMKEDQEFMV